VSGGGKQQPDKCREAPGGEPQHHFGALQTVCQNSTQLFQNKTIFLNISIDCCMNAV
jgi:hypothetical protein